MRVAPAVLLLALLAVGVLGHAPADAALGGRWLERGDRGQDVRDLQRALRRLGHRVGVDGWFGPATERAVRRYEREERIDVDGEVSKGQGRGMVRRVEERAAGDRRERGERRAFGSRTLARGDRGPAVKRLQEVLSGLGYRTVADGDFGPGTEANVERYEREEDITVDGRVSGGQARGMQRRLEDRGPVGDEQRSEPAPVGRGHGWFPIAGRWAWGGGGAGFGERDGAHRGQDLVADCGTPLVSAEAGRVVFKAFQERAGHYVVIRGARSGHDHVYMHLESPSPVDRGDAVRLRQPIGSVGDTGNARGCHLHFELWSAPGWFEGGAAFDPRPSLERWARSTRAALARR